LVLLSAAAWLQAQAGYPQADSSQMGQTAGTAGQATVEGCLQNSNGNFTLTADSGSVYQLTGDTSKLSEHVGHEVRIIGTTSGETNSPSATTPGTPQAAMLEVKDVKHVSKTCKSSAK